MITAPEILEIESLDFEPPCDSVCEEGYTADFIVHLFCGCIRLWCTACLEDLKNGIASFNPVGLTCARCSTCVLVWLVSDFIVSAQPL